MGNFGLAYMHLRLILSSWARFAKHAFNYCGSWLQDVAAKVWTWVRGFTTTPDYHHGRPQGFFLSTVFLLLLSDRTWFDRQVINFNKLIFLICKNLKNKNNRSINQINSSHVTKNWKQSTGKSRCWMWV